MQHRLLRVANYIKIFHNMRLTILPLYSWEAAKTAASHSISVALLRSNCQYFVGVPNAMLSTVTVYGPAKSWITPSAVHIPVCPISGKNHLKTLCKKVFILHWSIIFISTICYVKLFFSFMKLINNVPVHSLLSLNYIINCLIIKLKYNTVWKMPYMLIHTILIKVMVFTQYIR